MKLVATACILGMSTIVSLSLLAGYIIGAQPLVSIAIYVTASSLAVSFGSFFKIVLARE